MATIKLSGASIGGVSSGGGGGSGPGTSWTSTASIAVGDIFTGHTVAEVQPGQTYTPTNTGSYYKVVSNFAETYLNIVGMVWFPAANKFVAVGNYSNPKDVTGYMYSSDGFTWQNGEFVNPGALIAMAASPTMIVAVTNFSVAGTSNRAKISYDGVNWTEVQGPVGSTTPNVVGIAYGNGVFVAVSANVAWRSTDGINWSSEIATGYSSQIRNVSFVNDRFLAVTGTGRYAMSTDGLTWTVSNFIGSNTSLNGATYAFGQYALIGAIGTVRTSPDLVTWTDRVTRLSFSTSPGRSVVQMGSTLYISDANTPLVVTTDDWVTYKTLPISTIMGSGQNATFGGLATDGNKVVGGGAAQGAALNTLSSMAKITDGIYTNQLTDPVPAGTYRCLGRSGDSPFMSNYYMWIRTA
jgi:hypothetical protein